MCVIRADLSSYGQLREWIKINFNIDALLLDWSKTDTFHMVSTDGKVWELGCGEDPLCLTKPIHIVVYSKVGGLYRGAYFQVEPASK